MRKLFVILASLACLASLASSAACSRRASATSAAGADRRVIVLGFDGLDYDITRTLMAAGRLPNFSRLAKRGRFSPLGTTMPPQSPVAWSSFTTGLDPAEHGIFDFVHRDPATLAPYLSTTRTDPPSWLINLGRWQIPLRGGRVTPLRDGQPFWAQLEAQGVRTTIMRMPANYPPSGQATRELTGMGTPDLLGTYGTFSFYTSDPSAFDHVVAGGKIHRLQFSGDGGGNAVEAQLEGPDNPFLREKQALTMPLVAYRDAHAAAARIVIGNEQRVLSVGEWSDWVPITFTPAPMQSLRGICRLYLKQVRPTFELYVTPINLDPLSPALPISTPASYAADIARATGRFYTQGMPEDTKAYSADVFNADEFLRQAANSADENRRQYLLLLDQFHADAGAAGTRFLFHYFGHVDLVSHMMFRARDPEAPAYNAARDARYAHVIDDLYVGLDTLVGLTLDRMPPDTLLIVMSDHGFASWRRAFHLNAWLEQHGYLTVLDPTRRAEPAFSDVDWSRTRAYGLGLNGLYINLKGREKSGIVDPAQRAALAAEIANALLKTEDPATHQRAITAVYQTPETNGQIAHADRAPDLIVGYAKGTRCSNESALGAVPDAIMSDNIEAWSGDHCMDPASVPGVLFTSRPLTGNVSTLRDLPSAIVDAFK